MLLLCLSMKYLKLDLTVIFIRDSIIKNISPNLWSIKNMLSNIFLRQKLQIWTIRKPTQEKSPLKIIIHVGTSDLSSDKEPKDKANNIIQLAKSVKSDTNKVAVYSILPRKNKFNSKVREVSTHLICSTNNLPLITHSNINPQCHINVKCLHLNSYDDNRVATVRESEEENGFFLTGQGKSAKFSEFL